MIPSLRYLLSLLLISVSLTAIGQNTTDITVRKSEAERGLQEVNSKFTFRGKVINPKVINAFVPWMSDHAPSTISIDLVTATGSNQYYLEPEDTGTSASFKDLLSGTPMGYCSYRHIGKTESGIHVLQVTTNGGGSGNFGWVLFFSFKVKKGFDIQGKYEDQLLMTLEKIYMTGDRIPAKVTISKNKVIIDKPVDMPKAVELNF